MDVVEQALASDPFYAQRVRASGTRKVRNRQGRTKTYSALTCELVERLAERGLDPVRMRRSELLGRAFEMLSLEQVQKQALVA
jgi:hypothetical protein